MSDLFSASIALMASSITAPISGVWAAAEIVLHRACSGTKKMLSARYASLSSSKPSPTATSSLNLRSNALEIYLRKINPTITFLYSAAGICPHRTQAASQICFSKPMFALFCRSSPCPPVYIKCNDMSYFRCYLLNYITIGGKNQYIFTKKCLLLISCINNRHS